MGMTPDQFFEAFVRGNNDDCQQHPGCIRRAFNAAVSASHLADHYLAYYQKHDPSRVKCFRKTGDFVEYLSKNTGCCFRDIRSISNAYKHLYTSIDPNKSVHSSISSTGAIESLSFSDENTEIKKVEGESIGKEFKSTVVFTRKNGQQIKFYPTLDKVVEYWEELLYRT